MPVGAVLIPILVTLGLFALVFGIVYMQKKENLAMMEKGWNPRVHTSSPSPFRNLKWGLLLFGAGLGLLAAFLLDEAIHWKDESDTEIIYMALLAIGGGAGLIASYKIEKKDWLDRQDKKDQ